MFCLSISTEETIREKADCEPFHPDLPLGVRQNLSFHVIGVSHHTAAVQVREQFAFNPAQTASMLELLRQADMPAVLLSTCNRCELYWVGPGDGVAWFHQLARDTSPAPGLPLTRYEGMAAIRHLFLVTAGLDSQIVGETEVLGQVRRAYDAARAAGTTTRQMDLIFSAALSAGRRVRRETVLGRHPASVSSAAVDLVLQHWGDSSRRQVILLGAGEAAEGVLRALNEHSRAEVTLLSRHPDKARTLASGWHAKVGGWEELEQSLNLADVLMVATASARPVISAAQLARTASTRDGRELLVVDLAVPRNVEPESRRIDGIQLLDLDDLQRLCCPAAGTASAELAEAEGVIEDELVRLGLSLRNLVVAPYLTELHRISLQMAQEESEWALAQLGALSDTQRKVVQQMADRLVRKVLYPVSRKIRSD